MLGAAGGLAAPFARCRGAAEGQGAALADMRAAGFMAPGASSLKVGPGPRHESAALPGVGAMARGGNRAQPPRSGRRQQQQRRRPRRPTPPVEKRGTREDLSPKITGLPTGLSVTWLGTSSGAPTTSRNVSSIACRFHHATYLVDCGEGTQAQLIKSDVFPGHIKRVFITHLHGDHSFGLPGLLNMISTVRQYSWKGEPVHVYGPPGLEELLKMSLPHWYGRFYMPVHVTEFTMDANMAHEPRSVVKGKRGEVTVSRMGPTTSLGRLVHRHLPPFQQGNRGLGVKLREGVLGGHQWVIPCDEGITVTAAQLQHRVPCWGYIMSEEEYIPSDWEVQLERKRREKQLSELPDPPPDVLWVDPDPGTALRVPGRKVVLLGDTCNSDALAQAAYGADLVSHEATFARGMEEKAEVAQHSTAVMAGEFARKIGAKQLVLTHFSPRYQQDSSSDSHTINGLVEEAKQGFRSDNVVAAHDFFTYHVPKRRPIAATGEQSAVEAEHNAVV